MSLQYDTHYTHWGCTNEIKIDFMTYKDFVGLT